MAVTRGGRVVPRAVHLKVVRLERQRAFVHAPQVEAVAEPLLELCVPEIKAVG